MQLHRVNSSSYMPQLDALRALAVFAVLIHHLINPKYLPLFLGEVPLGYLGVRLFFVLSGFLITGILLQSRFAVEASKAAPMFCARQFYIRRFLRIFPLYYGVIAIALALGVPEAYEDLPWLLSYLHNIHLSLQGWYPEYFAHFWSLAVEEQFYIFWPWLILFAPRRALFPVVLGVILLAPLYRFLAMTLEFNGVAVYVFTLSSLDALGIGSLLALMTTLDKSTTLQTLSKWMLTFSLVGLFSLQVWLWGDEGKVLYFTFFEFFVAISFGWLVLSAAVGFDGVLGKVLEARALAYIGRISYGIYVYHLLAPPLVRRLYELLGVTVEHKGPAEFLSSVIATLLFASLSWRFFEAPMNNLKRFFPYARQPYGLRQGRARSLPARLGAGRSEHPESTMDPT